MNIKAITPSWLTLGEPLNSKSFRRLFSEFLKFNNIYSKFRENSDIQKSIIGRDGNFFYLYTRKRSTSSEETLIIQLIDYSFTWAHTKEGHSFWQEVNRQWHNTIRQYNLVGAKNFL